MWTETMLPVLYPISGVWCQAIERGDMSRTRLVEWLCQSGKYRAKVGIRTVSIDKTGNPNWGPMT
jgi:hypothetical protein